jgi:adenylate kinase family enzyme
VERILIIGSGGSGKSHLSRKLGALLHLPVIHLDRIFWRPGWGEIPREDWTKLVEKELARSQWIMEGDYRENLDLRLAACDTVVFLHLARVICVWRALIRTYQHKILPRPDVPEGCVEKLNFRFLRRIWRYPEREAPEILEKLRDLGPGRRVLVLKSRREVAWFLKSLRVSPHTVSTAEFGCASS